ncbi:MAG: hypothetical protein K6E33_09465, partial [Lachnospiraceae bacterium]|nr:hypothetical protein [Lachnospiraceae bacterium]
MTLTIFSFLYLSIVCLVFFNIRESLRIGTLAVASVLYVLSLNQRAAVFVLVVSVLTWGCGLLTGFLLKKERRVAAGFSAALPIIAAIAALALFKYGPDLKSEGIMDFPFKVVMPIGFSFYIFQVISYLTDIYKGTVEADRSWLKVFIYLCWFPKFVSGPIERKDAFDTQIQKVNKVSFLHTVPWGKVFSYILTGCFYKIVIADRLGIYVKKLFEEYGDYGSLWLIIGAFMYSFQIYCDFAGYSYAAIGISEIFGIELTENFMMPYYSANITEFWRRWHRSLSSWLKDY